ncbi:MAG: S8 family peptidase, partial [Actinomycetia bacterium]|nr:S8 family peptidase [Actinomycetes bacterium]
DSDSDSDSDQTPYTHYPTRVGADLLHQQGIRGQGITVAVLDTGIWSSHPHLHRNTDGEERLLAQFDTGAETASAVDHNGHGTHVASIILSSDQPDDDDGRYNGIAPDADLVAVKAFDEDGHGTYADVILGLDWLIAHREAYGIRILNLSFSAPAVSLYWQDPLNQAVMAAWQAGIVVLTSAGNTGPQPMTVGVPGNLPYVITVGAMSDAQTPGDPSDDYLTEFSAAGPTFDAFVKPELVAPGGHMLGLMRSDHQIAMDHPQHRTGADYFTMSGTSQAV